MVLSRSTELEAVNTMLASVGVQAETSIESLNGEGAIALTTLREVSRAVQSIGWHFNTQEEVTVTPDTDGYATLGSNVVRADQKDGTYTAIDVCQRGDKLYDRKNNTYQFSDEFLLTVVILLDWDELPEPARGYIMQRATRIFKDRVRADNKGRQSEPTSEEFQALATLKIMEGDTADHSIFDSAVTFRIIDRQGDTFF